MARKRMIDPSFWTDEKLGLLTPMHRLLFMGLISNADDEGRLQGHPALVKSMIFPYDVDITHQQVEKWLIDLHNEGLILIYEVGKQRYIWIPNFLKYQQINRPTPSKLPAPPENAEVTYISINNESSQNTHEQLTEDSLNTHEQFSEDSVNTHAEKNRKEKEIEKEKKENRKESDNRESVSSDDDDRASDDPKIDIKPSEVVEMYNTICKSLPKVMRLSNDRRKKIRTLIKNVRDRTLIETVFRKVEESDFLSGRSGKWSGCNFDWIIKYNNFVRILEGVYDNKASPLQTNNQNNDLRGDKYAEFYE